MGRFKSLWLHRDIFVKNIDGLNEYLNNFEHNLENINDSIIAVGDVHGSFLQAILPLIIGGYIHNVHITEDEILYDINKTCENNIIIVYLGDIFDYAYHDEYYLIVNMLINLITTFPNYIYWCYGNHDTKEFLRVKDLDDRDEDELNFYNFSCNNARVFYYNQYFNFLFSHTVLKSDFFTKFSVTTEYADIWKFLASSETVSTYSETFSTYSETLSRYAEDSEKPKIAEAIEKFNKLVLQNLFNGDDQIKIDRIDSECFYLRYEHIASDYDIAFDNINKVIGHDITNLTNYNKYDKLYLADFDAMHVKRRILKTYFERPRFFILRNSLDDAININIKIYDELMIKG